jgi:hypothetical protein
LEFVHFLLGLSDRPANVYTNYKSKPHALQHGFSQPFQSQLAENLTAFFLQQPPLMCTTGALPPKVLYGFVGELIAGYSLVRGSNHAIWQLRKTKKYFDLKAGQHFVFTALDASGCWCPQRLFSFFDL